MELSTNSSKWWPTAMGWKITGCIRAPVVLLCEHRPSSIFHCNWLECWSTTCTNMSKRISFLSTEKEDGMQGEMTKIDCIKQTTESIAVTGPHKMNTSSRSVPKTHRVHPTNWHVGLQIPSHHYEMIVHPNQPHHQQHCLIDLNQSLFLNDQLQLCLTKLHHHPRWLKWPQKHSQNLQAEV